MNAYYHIMYIHYVQPTCIWDNIGEPLSGDFLTSLELGAGLLTKLEKEWF